MADYDKPKNKVKMALKGIYDVVVKPAQHAEGIRKYVRGTGENRVRQINAEIERTLMGRDSADDDE